MGENGEEGIYSGRRDPIMWRKISDLSIQSPCFFSNSIFISIFFFLNITLLSSLSTLASSRVSELSNNKGKYGNHETQQEAKKTQTEKIDFGALFDTARTIAFQGNRKEAREICKNILEKKPGYHVVRVFLGRSYAWDKEYNSARKELQEVIKAKPDYLDAYKALIDVESWSKNFQQALKYCDQSLKSYPDNEDCLLKKSRILVKLENLNEAIDTVKQLLKINPSHKEALQLLEKIQPLTQQYEVKFRYRYDNFKRGEREYGPWHLFSFDISGKYKFGTFIGRINYASRNFGSRAKSGTQYEFDVYPKIAKGLYAYLNAGYSSSPIFPKYRFGGEIYKNLPLSLEISAGVRYLNFTNTNVIIYTGNLGEYYKNYWFSLRPFVTSKSSGLSFSGILSIRSYSGNADDYTGLLLGYGASPVELVFLEDIERLNSYKIGLEVQRLLARTLLIKLIIRFEREEFKLDNFGNRFTLNISLQQLIFKKY